MKCSNPDCKNEIPPQHSVEPDGLCGRCAFERWRTATPDLNWDTLLKRVADMITGEDVRQEDVIRVLLKDVEEKER